MKKPYDKKARSFLPYIFVMVFFSGIVSGCVLALLSGHVDGVASINSGSSAVFLSSFKSFLKPCVAIWILGFFRLSPYLISMVLAYRGAVFGFAVCTTFKTWGFVQGLLKALTFSLPQNIIFFPFLFFLSTACSVPERKKAGYFVLIAITVIICAISAFIDTFITSKLVSFTFR